MLKDANPDLKKQDTRSKNIGAIFQGGGEGVLSSIYNRCVPERFLSPAPIQGLKIPKLIPILRPKPEKLHHI